MNLQGNIKRMEQELADMKKQLEQQDKLEMADKNMVARNRLEAYVHEIQGDSDGNWLISELNPKVYIASQFITIKPIGIVFMQKKTAEILCEALNKGEIKL